MALRARQSRESFGSAASARASARIRLISSAFCSPVEHWSAGSPLAGFAEYDDKAHNDIGIAKVATLVKAARAFQIHEARTVFLEVIDFPKPLVSAVNGPAVGLGCSIALLSDLLVMGENSLVIGTSYS